MLAKHRKSQTPFRYKNRHGVEHDYAWDEKIGKNGRILVHPYRVDTPYDYAAYYGHKAHDKMKGMGASMMPTRRVEDTVMESDSFDVPTNRKEESKAHPGVKSKKIKKPRKTSTKAPPVRKLVLSRGRLAGSAYDMKERGVPPGRAIYDTLKPVLLPVMTMKDLQDIMDWSRWFDDWTDHRELADFVSYMAEVIKNVEYKYKDDPTVEVTVMEL